MNFCSETGNCLTVDYQRYVEDIREKDEKISKLEMKNEELRDLYGSTIKALKEEIKRLEEELKEYD